MPMRWRYNIMSHSNKLAGDVNIMPSFYHWCQFDTLFFNLDDLRKIYQFTGPSLQTVKRYKGNYSL